jgi:hypothetical protein
VAEWSRADVDEALAIATRCLCQHSLADRESFVSTLAFLLPWSSPSSAESTTCRQYLFSFFPALSASAASSTHSAATSRYSNSGSSSQSAAEYVAEGADESSSSCAGDRPASSRGSGNVVSRNAGKIYQATRSALKQGAGASAALLLQDEEKLNPLDEGAASELRFTHEAFCNYCEQPEGGDEVECPYDTAQLSYVLILAQLLYCNRHNAYVLFFCGAASC